MKKIKTAAAWLLLSLFATTAIAAETTKPEPKAQLRDPAEFQKVIDDYKAYVATIPPEIRDEIIAFRKDVAKLNKEKSLLYRKLSQASQNYLKKEQQYKQKLPLNRKSLINIDPAKIKEQKAKSKK
ncbi:MAG: hypothetical protein NWR41_00680 [Rickettsiaceae bacterium]|nr:hypothetical protein [Rickettsiaceae bacterium]MDP5082993.1 hypothetical protein [Rickettsiaceae bacterium]